MEVLVIGIKEMQINEEITDKEVRLISNDGEQLGIVSAAQAQKLAAEKNLDLVKIAPQAKPPVCKIMDYGIRDSFNMGCAMAPAACDTILTNLRDFNRQSRDYDAIITGDLGNVGKDALFKLLEEQKIDISDRYYDCGMLMYDTQKQDVHAGGSGCGCSATVLSAYLLHKIEAGEWNRILFVPTGALLNKTSFNEGQNVPGIAHGVVIEATE